MFVTQFLRWVATLTIPQQAVVLVGLATLFYWLLWFPVRLVTMRRRAQRDREAQAKAFDAKQEEMAKRMRG